MLQSCLIVHDHIGIVGNVLVHLALEHGIDVAVAAFALGPAHDQHIEVILLDQGLGELHFREIPLGHTGGDGLFQLCLGHFLPDLSQRGLHLHAQNLVEVGIGICVHYQHRAVALLAQAVDHHTADGGFSDAAFTGDCDGMRLCHGIAPRLLNSGIRPGPEVPHPGRCRPHRRTCSGYTCGCR